MYALVATALFASLAVSASIPGLPACAGNCITSFGSCNNLDVKCICADSSLIAGLACCVSTACNTADQEKTIQFADALCAGYGIKNLPSAATCASSSGPTSTKATPVPQMSLSSSMMMASTAAMSVTSANPAPMSVSSAISAAVSSASASDSSASAAASSSVLSAISSASTAATGAQGSGTAASASAASATGNVGSKNQAVEFGILAAVLVAAF